MPFSLNSTQITLNGTILEALCETGQDRHIQSSIDLNNHLGNKDGHFDIRASGFLSGARSISLDGSILNAELQRKSGEWIDASINLDLCVENQNGKLEFVIPSDRITVSASAMHLSGSILQGLCIHSDGKLYPSEIDLNEHYANNNGRFASNDRGFYHTSKDLKVNISNEGVILRGKLRDDSGRWRSAKVDLSVCIVNMGGGFRFVYHDSLLGRDGQVAQQSQHVPVVGLVVAALQYAAGNEDWTRKALAFSANSTIVSASVLIGSLGGAAGAALAAGLAKPIAMLVQDHISGKARAETQEAIIGRYLYDTLLTMFTTGAAAHFGSHIGKLTESTFEAASPAISRAFGQWATSLAIQSISKWVASLIGKTSGSMFVRKLSDALIKGQLPKEWLQGAQGFLEEQRSFIAVGSSRNCRLYPSKL
ncbi:hypothetical protein VNI00_010243 [Paramarasmius palmivorus]|uniref:Cyanovirin-N domain-containing protein n=1 Tax=Paramarasmius palmivorus TaxID=297713 RepID=A0AAW0CJ56_9AGAR